MRILLASVAALAAASTADAAVIDFEEYAAGQVIDDIFGTPYPFLQLSGTVVDFNGGKGLEIFSNNIVRFFENNNIPGPTRRKVLTNFVSIDVLGQEQGDMFTYAGAYRTFHFDAGVTTTLTVGTEFFGNGFYAFKTFSDTLILDNIVTESSLLSVPEPDAWLTMGLGFGLLGMTLRRARRRSMTRPA